MADRVIKLRRLKQILASFGVGYTTKQGKGSHLMFIKQTPQGVFSYPVPDQSDVLICYVRGCRKKFKLTPDDGVADKDFYNA